MSNALTKHSLANELLRVENKALDLERPQQHFIEILEAMRPMLKKHTRRPDATDVWIAQTVRAGSRGKPPKTPRLTFTQEHRTVADVYGSLVKRGNIGFLHLVADIPYTDPEEETGDFEDQLPIKEEVKTPTPKKGRQPQKNTTPKAGRNSRKNNNTLPKNKPSLRTKKEPISTSKQAVVKQEKETPPIKEEELMESFDEIFNEEDRFSDNEEHQVSQSQEEDISDAVRTYARLTSR